MNYHKNRKGEAEEYSENVSGIRPVEDKVLLLPDMIKEETSGGLHKPEVVVAQEQLAQVRALLVAMGGNCFEDWDEPVPKVGDRLMVCKYAGILDIQGADGMTYQICTDRDITAILDEDLPQDDPGSRKPLSKEQS